MTTEYRGEGGLDGLKAVEVAYDVDKSRVGVAEMVHHFYLWSEGAHLEWNSLLKLIAVIVEEGDDHVLPFGRLYHVPNRKRSFGEVHGFGVLIVLLELSAED